MEAYDIDRSEIKNMNPVAEGYKVIKWDNGTQNVRFRYGEPGENIVGKVFKIDEELDACKCGLHFSKDPADVFNFYAPLGCNRYFKVRAYDKCIYHEGAKSVTNILEFVEEYDIMEYIDVIKNHGRTVGSNAVSNRNAVQYSYAVRNSSAVSVSDAVSYSAAVINSNAVSGSVAVSGSGSVSESRSVDDSNAVHYSDAVSNSNAVRGSRSVSYSNAVDDSNAVSTSDAVSYSNAVYMSDETSESTAVSYSKAVCDSNAVCSSVGIINCNGVYASLFCYGKNGITHYIFNKESNEKRYKEIYARLMSFQWFPEFQNWKDVKGNKDWPSFCFPKLKENDNKTAWSTMPAEMMEYIKSLPEFDKDVWDKITGD